MKRQWFVVYHLVSKLDVEKDVESECKCLTKNNVAINTVVIASLDMSGRGSGGKPRILALVSQCGTIPFL